MEMWKKMHQFKIAKMEVDVYDPLQMDELLLAVFNLLSYEKNKVQLDWRKNEGVNGKKIKANK